MTTYNFLYRFFSLLLKYIAVIVTAFCDILSQINQNNAFQGVSIARNIDLKYFSKDGCHNLGFITIYIGKGPGHSS